MTLHFISTFLNAKYTLLKDENTFVVSVSYSLIYSQTCVQRPLMGNPESGLCTQVAFVQRVNISRSRTG